MPVSVNYMYLFRGSSARWWFIEIVISEHRQDDLRAGNIVTGYVVLANGHVVDYLCCLLERCSPAHAFAKLYQSCIRKANVIHIVYRRLAVL